LKLPLLYLESLKVESVVALFAEDLEDCEHSAPSSDYAILYPRNPDFVLVVAEGNLRRVCGHPAASFRHVVHIAAAHSVAVQWCG